MSTLQQDRAWHEYIMGRGDFPFYQKVKEVPLPEGFYVCITCKQVTNYWESGMVCYNCEAAGERQQEADKDR